MPKSKSKTLDKVATKRSTIAIVLLLLIFSAIGLLGLRSSQAASFTAAAEAESGARVGNAGPGATAGASGGASVAFGVLPPTGGGSCALPTYPTPECTGVPAGTALTVVNQTSLFIDQNNTVIDGQDIRGCVSVRASGVIIKRSKISCPTSTPLQVIDIRMPDNSVRKSSLTIEDSEISCQTDTGTGVSAGEIIARRIKIQGCHNGMTVIGSKVILEDSLIHQLRASGSTVTGRPGTGLTITGQGVAGSKIQHNTIYANNGLQAINMQGVVSPDILIASNLIAGGSVALQCRASSLGSVGTVRLTDNHFSTIFYPTVGSSSPWQNCQDKTVVTGNVYHETGRPL